MQFIECGNELCKKHSSKSIGIHVLAQKGTDHYFCSIKCIIDYIHGRNLKKYELICDDEKLTNQFIEEINKK